MSGSLKLSREDRDLLYREIGDHLYAFTDMKIAGLRKHRERIERIVRVLDDIGWEERAERETVQVTRADDLAILARTLQDEADGCIADANIDHMLDLRATCERVLEQVVR